MKIKTNKKDFIERCRQLQSNGIMSLQNNTKADQIDAVFIDAFIEDDIHTIVIYGGNRPLFGKCYIDGEVIEEGREECISNLSNMVTDVKSLKKKIKDVVISITPIDISVYDDGDEDNSSAEGRRLIPMSSDIKFWYNSNSDSDDTIKFKMESEKGIKEYLYIPWFHTENTATLKDLSKRGYGRTITETMVISTKDGKIKLSTSNKNYNRKDNRTIDGIVINEHTVDMKYYDPIFFNLKGLTCFYYYYNENTTKTKVWIKNGSNEWMIIID